MRTLARVAGILFAACLSLSCQPSVPDDLSGLLDAMGGTDMRVQWAASKKVELHYGTTGLLAALRHPNPGTRARAALWLESHPGQDVQEALIATSSDLNEHVRMWVAFSLGRIGDARALSCREVLEHDPSEIVRLKAVKALEQVRARQRADTKA